MNWEDLGTRLSCFGIQNGWTFHSFHEKEQPNYWLKTYQEQQEDNSRDDIRYLENICGTEQPFISETWR